MAVVEVYVDSEERCHSQCVEETLESLHFMMQRIEDKLELLISLTTEGNQDIMSQLSELITAVNEETNLISESAAADAAQTEVNATAIQALRDQIAAMVAAGQPATQADLEALDAIKASLAGTKVSLDATAARLAAIAADPANPVPTP